GAGGRVAPGVGGAVIDGVGRYLRRVDEDVAHECAVQKCFVAEIMPLVVGHDCAEVGIGIANVDSGRIASKQDCKTVRQEAAYSGEEWAALFSRTSQGVVAIFAKSHTRQKPRHWPDTEPQNEAQPGNHGSVDTARGRRLARFTRDTPDKPDEVEKDRDLKPQSEEGGIGQAICDKARD